MKVGNDIYYVGVNDHQVDLFEGQYDVPNGMSYNSYVIMDEKIAVMDTVDAHFAEEWLGNVAKVLNGAKPDNILPICIYRFADLPIGRFDVLSCLYPTWNHPSVSRYRLSSPMKMPR